MILPKLIIISLITCNRVIFSVHPCSTLPWVSHTLGDKKHCTESKNISISNPDILGVHTLLSCMMNFWWCVHEVCVLRFDSKQLCEAIVFYTRNVIETKVDNLELQIFSNNYILWSKISVNNITLQEQLIEYPSKLSEYVADETVWIVKGVEIN